MDSLADLALRFPEVALVLAHAGIADQGMFATRLAGHPAVLYDTSTFSSVDLLELFARFPRSGSCSPPTCPTGGRSGSFTRSAWPPTRGSTSTSAGRSPARR